MVVLSEGKRRKRTEIGGMGARGRRARYSCSKIWTNSGDVTAFRLQVTDDRLHRIAKSRMAAHGVWRMPQMFAWRVAIWRKCSPGGLHFSEGLTFQAIPICGLVAGKVANQAKGL